ncbi:MAG: hypothetical protein OEZ31_04825 [Nitrospirota bacterium]|nr:hypothetical protein [Nitrospirota bacterium]MDH5768267.1 hypothetical protein [Nitrospirota bacterium]
MYIYKAYNLVIASDKALPESVPVDKAEVDVQVLHTSSSETLDISSKCFMHWHLSGGELWLSIANVNGGYLLRFNEIADFFVSKYGKEIFCMPKPEIPKETIQHLLLDQVIPLVINLKGGEALHASAVRTPQGVIAFAGLTGSGKSTIAGSFLQAGYPLISDDCLPLIEQNQDIYAIPAYPGLRLRDDSLEYLFGNNGNHKSVAHYTTKKRLCIEKRVEAFCEEPQLLKRLYIIADPAETDGETEVMIEGFFPKDSFMALVKCTFRLDITDQKMLERQFHFLKRVVSKVPVQQLTFPRNLNFLPAIREAILADLKTIKVDC